MEAKNLFTCFLSSNLKEEGSEHLVICCVFLQERL